MTFDEENKLHLKLFGLSRKLKIPAVDSLWCLRVADRYGNIVSTRKSFSHSFTRNLYNIFAMFCFGEGSGSTYADGSLAAKETDETMAALVSGMYGNLNALSTGYGYSVPDGDVTHGIVVGTGSTGESIDDYAMEALIADGTNPGEMEYQVTNTHTSAWNAGGSYWYSQYSRDIINNSGASITVNEMGIVWDSQSDGDAQFLTVRDVIDGGQPVANTQTLTATYETRFSFP